MTLPQPTWQQWPLLHRPRAGARTFGITHPVSASDSGRPLSMLPPPRCRELARTRRLSRTRWWTRTRRPARTQWMARDQRGGRQQASTLWLTRSAAGLHPASFTRSMTSSCSTAPLRFPSVSSGLPQPPCVGHAGLSALWLARSMAGLHPASFPRSMTGSCSGSRHITFNN